MTSELFEISAQQPQVIVCDRSHEKARFFKKEASEWGGPSDETGKTEIPCHSRCGTIKIKALSAEHRSKFCSPLPAMVTSPYE
jgi:hypothetical protein